MFYYCSPARALNAWTMAEWFGAEGRLCFTKRSRVRNQVGAKYLSRPFLSNGDQAQTAWVAVASVEPPLRALKKILGLTLHARAATSDLNACCLAVSSADVLPWTQSSNQCLTHVKNAIYVLLAMSN